MRGGYGGLPGLRRGSPVAIVNEVALGVGPLAQAPRVLCSVNIDSVARLAARAGHELHLTTGQLAVLSLSRGAGQRTRQPHSARGTLFFLNCTKVVVVALLASIRHLQVRQWLCLCSWGCARVEPRCSLLVRTSTASTTTLPSPPLLARRQARQDGLKQPGELANDRQALDEHGAAACAGCGGRARRRRQHFRPDCGPDVVRRRVRRQR